MESQKLALKLFVEDSSAISGHEFVPIFHSWIQQKKVADHLTIDVADYEHVHNGPGTLLITLEANFATDWEDNRLGLLYVRKRAFSGADTFAERLQIVLHTVLEAAQRLESEPALAGKIKFRTDEMLFRIYDRLLTNTAETLADVKPELESLLTELYGKSPVAFDLNPSPESVFEVRIQTGGSPPLAQLISHLPAAVATPQKA